MKRIGNLWPQLSSWENLTESAHAAARGKRKRPDVARFLHELEPNFCRLQRELEDLRLVPHVRKFRVYPCDEGLTLLGWRILPAQMRLARSNVIRIFSRFEARLT
jgi:hypothetical protein